jgi:hypothetical protein
VIILAILMTKCYVYTLVHEVETVFFWFLVTDRESIARSGRSGRSD